MRRGGSHQPFSVNQEPRGGHLLLERVYIETLARTFVGCHVVPPRILCLLKGGSGYYLVNVIDENVPFGSMSML